MAIAVTIDGWEGLSSGEEAVVINWFVRVGQKVESQMVLAEIMVEKVNLEIIAPQAGIIQAILAPEGTIVTPGTTLTLLDELGREPGIIPDSLEEVESPHQPAEFEIISSVDPASASPKDNFVLASPAARRLAKELNLNLESAAQSLEPGVRINEAAILNFLALSTGNPAGPISHAVPGRRQRQPRLRKLIRSRVSRATQLAAAVTLSRRVDVSRLVSWLDRQNQLQPAAATPLTILAAILRASALALLDYPIFNSVLDGEDVIYKLERNISLVLPVSDGVVLPVIHEVDKLSLAQIAAAIAQLEAATRRETLRIKDTLGSTFTVSDLGSYAIDSFTPILNLPQAAILGVGCVATELAWRESPDQPGQAGPLDPRQLEIRRYISLSLTFDHRICDGPLAAAFLQAIANRLQDPYNL